MKTLSTSNPQGLWYQHAIFYEVNLRAFYDSNADGHGDLPGLIQKLDYLRDLGVDCLWLMPIYPSPRHDDGYDISDYCGIDPVFGTLDDFKRLLDESHRRGMRVITDLVLNHTSAQHPWFQAARADRNSPYRDFYVWSDSDQKYKDARIIFTDVETSNWTFDPLAGQYFWHRFYNTQPDLNFDNPAVQQAMLDVAKFWLDLGIDGFRVDAPPYLFEREGTSCENLPETHAYLKKFRAFVEQYNPQALLLSEANQWPEDVREYFGSGDEMQMNFHFPLMPRIFQSLAQAERAPIEEILARTPDLPAGCQWATFLRCHDELTLEMVTPEVRRFMWDFYAPEPRMRLNMGIRRRLAPLLENHPGRLRVAHSILLTLIGSPTLYYGDEIGMGDNIWLSDRNGVRTPMQWEAGPNAGFSTAQTTYAPLIADETYGYPRLNVASQEKDPDSLLNWLRRVIRTRRLYPAFGDGTLHLLPCENPAILAYLRQNSDQTLLAVNNLSADSQTFRLDLAAASLNPLLEGETVLADGSLTLPAYGFQWYQLSSTPESKVS
ncbi:MAG: maltose alpha-D-glucosyltransferase [Chloroflexi bacterium HGW-Chloroflexi-6]|nr:MAG: maltose alpha-D-glucosyltransferase [Chloroflexi bacterium HGW-Chloroflexi-6]